MRRLTVGAVAAVLVTACGQETDDPTPDPTVDGHQLAGFDPCDLIPHEDLVQLDFVDTEESARMVSVARMAEPVVSCEYSHGLRFVFGYAGDHYEGDLLSLLDYDENSEASGELTSIEDLGDEAYHLRGAALPTQYVVVQSGDEQLYLYDAIGITKDQEATETDVLIDLARTMIENLPDDVAHESIDLPNRCPPPDDENVAGITGDVALARGVQGHMTFEMRCVYRSETGVHLTLEVIDIDDPEEFAAELEQGSGPTDRRRIDGRTVYVDGDRSNIVTIGILDDETYYRAQSYISTRARDRDEWPSGDEMSSEPLVDLVQAVIASAA